MCRLHMYQGNEHESQSLLGGVAITLSILLPIPCHLSIADSNVKA